MAKQWVPAAKLKKGEHLQTPDGTLAVADGGVTPKDHDGDMWDLTVPGNNDHDFYVLPADDDPTTAYHVDRTGVTAVLVHNCDGVVSWVPENTSRSSAADEYEAGAFGARSDVATQQRLVPELDYYDVDGELKGIRFDGFDEDNGVLIDRKLGVATTEKVQGTALKQSLALEQNGYSGLWEVGTKIAYRRATRMFERLEITNISVSLVPK